MSQGGASDGDLIHPVDRRAKLRLGTETAAGLDQALVLAARPADPRASVLLSGPRGKTRAGLAETLAAATAQDLLRADLDRLVSQYIGETEKNLERLFDAARASGVVLFFDEADALFGTRTEVKDAHDRHANIEVSFLLQRIEAHTGLVILATNSRKTLDPELLRRIGMVLEFDETP